MRAWMWLVVGAAMATACAHESPFEIVGVAQVRELAEATHAPEIADVIDLGGVDVPARGRIRPSGRDGVAVVGEGLWVRGQGFGRQPTVYVAGAVALVLARTADGGIVVRVPPGTLAGKQTLRVRTLAGQAQVPLNVRRYAVAWNNLGQSRWLDASDEGRGPSALAQRHSVTLPAISRLAFSSDARAAYVLGSDARELSVIDVAADGGPDKVFALELEGKPVWALKAAALAPVLVVLRQDDVMVLSTVQAARPPRSRPRPLPAEVQKRQPIAAAVSPDGRHLAVAVAQGNQVALLSLSERSALPIEAWLTIDDGMRAPPIRDLGFAMEGNVLWVLSGPLINEPNSGAMPTTLSRLTVQHSGARPTLKLHETHQLADAGVPTALGVSRTRPLPSGAAIRRPPSLARVLVGAQTREGKAGGLFAIGESGAMLVTPVEGRATDLLIEPQGHWAFSAVVSSTGASHLLWLRADGREATPQTLALWDESTVTTCWVEVQP